MSKKVIIIAEAGVNHNGDLDNAKNLIVEASKAGADYVKFQTFKTEKLVTKQAPKAEYQKKNLNDGILTQFNMLKNLEIPEFWYEELIETCKINKIKFLSTGFDEESIDFLHSINMDFFKIPSGELTNLPLLEHIAKKRKPVVISTGMANINEIKSAVDLFVQHGVSRNEITVLHCNTDYPTNMSDVNLLAMKHISKAIGVNVGYSDHTLGLEVSVAAVSLGAVIIEKHFTLNKHLKGPDHKASLNPDELSNMIKMIRNLEIALSGSGIKEPSISESKNIIVARKSIHIKNPVSKGKVIFKNDLIMKRPGDGISPMHIDKVIGKIANKNLFMDYKLNFEDLE